MSEREGAATDAFNKPQQIEYRQRREEKRRESRALNETNQNAIISIFSRRPAL